MSPWRSTIELKQGWARIVVTDALGDEVLRARLPRRCQHPRALLSLLESIALWSGSSLCAAVSVVDTHRWAPNHEMLGGIDWPADSALVQVKIVEERRPFRIRGLGSFRTVLQAHHRAAR